MTVHFAPAQHPDCSSLTRMLRCPAITCAANDNGPLPGRQAPSDAILHAALRHFAAHGLGAARASRARAQEAFFAGDRQAYDWWMDITRTLDRRLLGEAQTGAHPGPPPAPTGAASAKND